MRDTDTDNSGKPGRVGLPARGPPSPRGPRAPTDGQPLQALAVLRGDGIPTREGRHIRVESMWPGGYLHFQTIWGVSFVQRRREDGKGSNCSYQTICLQTCWEKLQTVALKPAILPPGDTRPHLRHSQLSPLGGWFLAARGWRQGNCSMAHPHRATCPRPQCGGVEGLCS